MKPADLAKAMANRAAELREATITAAERDLAALPDAPEFDGIRRELRDLLYQLRPRHSLLAAPAEWP